jgi:hypothetical protein
MIVANFTGFFVKLCCFYEIWPVSMPLIFLGRKYFELCGLEIGHLAAVYKSVGVRGGGGILFSSPLSDGAFK